VWHLVEPFADRLNVDGVHWPEEVHQRVGEAVAEVIAGLVAGATEPPISPLR
jgi:hypothetical protein